jgi:hypothetical protein
VSGVPVVLDRHDGKESRRLQLLALHELRGSLERIAIAEGSRQPTTMALTPTAVVRELLELIAALDRRVPHVERTGETAIARDALALKALALKRIEELERQPLSASS